MLRRSELKPLAIGVLIGVAATLALGLCREQPAPPAAPAAASPADRYQISATDKQTMFVLDRQTGAVFLFTATADGFWTPTPAYNIPQGLKYLEDGPQGTLVAPGRH